VPLVQLCSGTWGKSDSSLIATLPQVVGIGVFLRPRPEQQVQDQDGSLQDQDQNQFLFVWDRSCHKTEVSDHITVSDASDNGSLTLIEMAK